LLTGYNPEPGRNCWFWGSSSPAGFARDELTLGEACQQAVSTRHGQVASGGITGSSAGNRGLMITSTVLNDMWPSGVERSSRAPPPAVSDRGDDETIVTVEDQIT
jgi:hypothetical protein